eukprot:CAMPEP_0185545034 /NCGR_PEP_ID=MMETSP1381-20130426/4484_1 /TAXON_ID=298111 /ORGANISM="Pavlova sp., Strain CCMP459" /LENGTH=175 /DNA_ID=CAMNT_0028157309 /DNA_START=1 /DNA_END=529 /DNA_ORIENTATION=+
MDSSLEGEQPRRLSDAWCRSYPFGTRRMLQETPQAIVQTGKNLLLVARTGGGKSLMYLLAAAAPWAAAMQAGTAHPPIALVVVPLVALGDNQEDSANRYLSDLHARGLIPRTAKALFVSSAEVKLLVRQRLLDRRGLPQTSRVANASDIQAPRKEGDQQSSWWNALCLVQQSLRE